MSKLLYRVNKVALLEPIALLVNEKKLNGIAYLCTALLVNEKELDAIAAMVQNNLPKKTSLWTMFSFLALFRGGTAPRRFTLRAHRCCWRGTPPTLACPRGYPSALSCF